MPTEQKALADSLKSTVRKRANLRSLFTREDKRVCSIIESQDMDGVQLLKVIQNKLVKSKEQLHRLDEEIQDLHMQMDRSDLADQDFEECDILYDNHGLIMNKIADFLSKVSSKTSTPTIFGTDVFHFKRKTL
ncbi:hypothetical protein LOTGIDRAFT_152268 [Lottia gigantea]|uniref:Uncharacterized protein n=1 Tax=Lottia gigantea TaxID=225164 RepID=V4BHS7_LOTGI|nr:hypothetical protein LOTGIDRAFT_152268 [Lottia gigantea]ESP05417.1 hypothetical protein LOTGIDRAFT_152268 [Lottia gigantea]